MLRLGIDLGGTKTEVVALDERGSQVLRRRVPTPAGDYAATVQAVVSLVRAAEAELGRTGTLGVAMPGALSRLTGRIKNANSTVLNGQPLRQDLEEALGREVRMANDANCFALSEATDGAGMGAEVVFGVILGTGVGGGIVVRGEVVNGINSIAGEWGHNPLAADDGSPAPACYCGRAGCVEAWLSGPALVAQYARRRAGPDSDTPVDAAEVARRALASPHDPDALAVLDAWERRLARALAGVINLLDPDVIVLGGGLSNIHRVYERVPELWREHVFSDEVRTRLMRNRHGDSGGVRGAAWLWGPQVARGMR
jgi:fructokinase